MTAEQILNEFEKIKSLKPLLFLDYDGTLVPINHDPDSSWADNSLKRLLSYLRMRYDLFIVTGRSLEDIRRFIGPDLNVVALHGAVISESGGDVRFAENIERYSEICNKVYSRKDEFLAKYPGIRMFNKNGGVVFSLWELEDSQIDRLGTEIESISAETSMNLYTGKKIMELRIPGINKGDTIRSLRNGRPALIAGDDVTDEDAFIANQDALSVKIGDEETHARFRVKDYLEFRSLLRCL